MPAWMVYFRKHPWQRRLLTGSLAMVLGGLGALAVLPYVRDYLLLRDLDSARAARREAAIARAVRRASDSPRTLRRLEEALDGASDRQFVAIVAALRWLGKFNVPGRAGEHVDRAWVMELSGNASAENRSLFLAEMLLAGRDNAYVRRGLSVAAADASAEVRALSSALAARLGDDAALSALLADGDPNVSAAAALDAGLARRTAHVEALRRLLNSPGPLSVRSAAACALGRIDPNAAGPRLAAMLARADEADNAPLRDRLLHVLSWCPSPASSPAVLALLDRARRAGRYPPAMALVAAGRLGLADAERDVRSVLADAAGQKSGLTVRQVLAAVQAAEALDLPVRKEAEALCRTLWSPRPEFRTMLTAAARLLGRQASRPQLARADTPSRAECIVTLRRAALYDYLPTTAPAKTQPIPRKTPVPSASAAAALWGLETPAAEEFIHNAAGEETTLPGDTVAWALGLTGTERAFAMGLSLLPAADAPPERRVYNDEARSAGAVLLALAGRTPSRRQAAARRVRSRLAGGRLGGEDNFHVRGAYHCALALLGDADSAREVVGLLQTGQFSQRRAITALTLGGELAGLDWLLWNPQVPPEDMLLLLVDEQLGDVLAVCLPEMPPVDAAAGDELAGWQLEILRRGYAIARARLGPRWPPPATTRPS